MSSYWHNRPYVPRAAPGKCGCGGGTKAPVSLTESQISSLNATTINTIQPNLYSPLSISPNNLNNRFFPDFSKTQFNQRFYSPPSQEESRFYSPPVQPEPSIDLSGSMVNNNFQFNRFPLPQKEQTQEWTPTIPSLTQQDQYNPQQDKSPTITSHHPNLSQQTIQQPSNSIFNAHGFPVSGQFNTGDLYNRISAVEFYQDKNNRSLLVGCTSCARR